MVWRSGDFLKSVHGLELPAGSRRQRRAVIGSRGKIVGPTHPQTSSRHPVSDSEHSYKYPLFSTKFHAISPISLPSTEKKLCCPLVAKHSLGAFSVCLISGVGCPSRQSIILSPVHREVGLPMLLHVNACLSAMALPRQRCYSSERFQRRANAGPILVAV